MRISRPLDTPFARASVCACGCLMVLAWIAGCQASAPTPVVSDCPMFGVWKLDYDQTLQNRRPSYASAWPSIDGADDSAPAASDLWYESDADLIGELAKAEWRFTCETQTFSGGPEGARSSPYTWRESGESTYYLRHKDANGREIGYRVKFDEAGCFEMTFPFSSGYWCRASD